MITKNSVVKFQNLVMNHESQPVKLNPAQSSNLLKRLLKIIALVYIYQLAQFGDLMSWGSKDILKMHPVSCTNTHHDIIDLVNHGMVKNGET